MDHDDSEASWSIGIIAPSDSYFGVPKLIVTDEAVPLEYSLLLFKKGTVQTDDFHGNRSRKEQSPTRTYKLVRLLEKDSLVEISKGVLGIADSDFCGFDF